MEKFCKELREYAAKIINYEKKEMIPLTDNENKSYRKQKVCYICKKDLILMKMIKVHLNYIIKSEIFVIIQENLNGLLTVFAV